MNRVLILGAHPDDEMGCAGTIAHLVDSGATVEVLTFSGCHDLIPEGFTADDLASEWVNACARLGVQRRHMTLLDIPNRHFPQHRQEILSTLDERRGMYDLVLVPSTGDAHQDHAAVAAEAVRVFKTTTMLGYELPLNAVDGSRLAAFVPLGAGALQAKLDHANAYRSQAAKPYMDSGYIEGLARVRGLQSGHQYAEAFEVIRWIW